MSDLEANTPFETTRGAQARLGLVAQVAAVFLAWGWLCWVGWDNDGLWFPRDAAVHLAHGLFWSDYLEAFPAAPKLYAKSYQARYPIIAPTKYPPLFYLAEAGVFRCFGPSPGAAKGVVLAAALVASLYQLAWLRRWVDREAGYFAALLPMLPDVAQYSHAILPNIPALALQLIALYHARRWLEEPSRGSQLYLGAGAATLATLCYQGAMPLVLVLAAWIVVLGRFALLRSPMVLVVAVAAAVPAAAWWVVSGGGPRDQAAWLVNNPYLARPTVWHWYTGKILRAFGAAPLGLAALGVLAGPTRPGWRREALLSGSWCLVTYGFFSYLTGKDPRYILPLATPVLALAAVATAAATAAATPVYRVTSRAFLPLLLVGLSGWVLWEQPIQRTSGFEPLAERIHQRAQRGVIVESNGKPGGEILIVRSMLLDRDLQRQFVGFRLLLIYAGVGRLADLSAYGATPEQAVAAILDRSGCEVVVVDQRRPPGPDPVGDALRAVLDGPSYALDQSLPIDEPSEGSGWADVYRRIIPVRPLNEFEVPAGSSSQDPGWFSRSRVTRPAPGRAKR